MSRLPVPVQASMQEWLDRCRTRFIEHWGMEEIEAIHNARVLFDDFYDQGFGHPEDAADDSMNYHD